MERYYYWASLIAADTQRERQQAAGLRRLLASRRHSDTVGSRRNLRTGRRRRLIGVRREQTTVVSSPLR